MKKTSLLIVVMLAFSSLFFSCYRTLDFDQAELTARPVIDADLAYFILKDNHLLDAATGLERTMVSDTTRIEIFDNVDVQNQLVRVDFEFKIKNEFKREFTASVRFLDESYNPTYTIAMNIDVATTTLSGVLEPINYVHTEQLILPTLVNDFKQTKFVVIDVALLPDASGVNPIVIGDSATFNFQSAGTFYFDLGI
jgi:hypothetical protein